MSVTTELLQRQIDWSRETFGPHPRTEGVLAHMASEIEEIRADPGDVFEWVDYGVLSADGAWRNTLASANSLYLSYSTRAAMRPFAGDLDTMISMLASQVRIIESIPNAVTGWTGAMARASLGAQRFAGVTRAEFEAAYAEKIERNMGRTWPDWRTVAEGQPIEHVREAG